MQQVMNLISSMLLYKFNFTINSMSIMKFIITLEDVLIHNDIKLIMVVIVQILVSTDKRISSKYIVTIMNDRNTMSQQDGSKLLNPVSITKTVSIFL